VLLGGNRQKRRLRIMRIENFNMKSEQAVAIKINHVDILWFL